MVKVTIEDVARVAGVSKTTVSRVVNGRVDVNAETAARVREAIDQLGFVKDHRAVQLASGRSDTIGVVAASGTDDWMIEVLRGAMRAAQERHYNIVLLTQPETEAEIERFTTSLRGRPFDGILVIQPRDRLGWLEDMHAHGYPVAVLDDHGSNPGVDAFVPNESVGINEAVEHLVRLGRKEIALLSGPEDARTLYTTTKRLEFYRNALDRYGLRLRDDLIVPAEYSIEGGRAGVDALMRRNVKFDALVASSDAMAVGAMSALKQAGLVVPRAVSVVGFDDFPSAIYTDPRLTTVHNPLFEMSARAIERLIGFGGSRSDPATVREVVPTHLIIRDSTGPANA